MLIASIVRILLSLRPGESTSHPRVMSDLITKLKGLRGNGARCCSGRSGALSRHLVTISETLVEHLDGDASIEVRNGENFGLAHADDNRRIEEIQSEAPQGRS